MKHIMYNELGENLALVFAFFKKKKNALQDVKHNVFGHSATTCFSFFICIAIYTVYILHLSDITLGWYTDVQ